MVPKIDFYLIETLFEQKPKGQLDVILCDVDGVLFDNTHRLHHIVEDEAGGYKEDSDWPAFNAEVGGDTPMGMCKVIGKLAQVYTVIFLTAREQNMFQMSTFVQAIKPFMPPGPRWFMQFRDVAEFPPKVPSHAYKRAMVDRMRAAGLNPVMAIDDSLDQVNMYKEAGIVALRCHDPITEKNMTY